MTITRLENNARGRLGGGGARNQSRRARHGAHSEIFGSRGPWRAAQGPFYTLHMGKGSCRHPSLGRNYGKNVAVFLLHFSLQRDSVELPRERENIKHLDKVICVQQKQGSAQGSVVDTGNPF